MCQASWKCNRPIRGDADCIQLGVTLRGAWQDMACSAVDKIPSRGRVRLDALRFSMAPTRAIMLIGEGAVEPTGADDAHCHAHTRR